MEHSYYGSGNFNILTVKRQKGHLIFTGETKEGLTEGDLINYPYNKELICIVDKISERRDSRDYPVDNGYFYKCECTGIERPVEAPVETPAKV